MNFSRGTEIITRGRAKAWSWAGLVGLVILGPLLIFSPAGRAGVHSSPTPRPRQVLGATTPGPAVSLSPAPAKAAATPGATAPAAAATPAPTEIATAVVCPGQNDPAQVAAALVCMSSHARQFHGLPATRGQDLLMEAAAAKAQDMAACGYSHTACGREFNYWIKTSGFAGHCSAENIAAGQSSPRAVFEAWMKSTGHRENILGANYTVVGVATAPGPDGPLWVMMLGGC